jgi:sporulation integral membrane protein YtvI
MSFSSQHKWILVLPALLAAILAWKILLPVALPFLLGGTLALAAEPLVRLLARKTRLRRGFCSAIGVTITLVLLTTVVVLAAAMLLRQVTRLAGAIPDLTGTARQGLSALEGSLRNLSDAAPDGIRPVLDRTITGLFSDGSAVLDKVTARIPGAITNLFGYVTGSALAVGTGIFGGYMISARLPVLKKHLEDPNGIPGKLLPRVKRILRALGGWLKAQLKLSAVSFLILTLGFLLLRVPNAILWAFLTALVDAVPLLGTGTILIPWAIFSLLQGKNWLGLGLLGLYTIAALTRSAMEPRLVGRQLGLDPLLTLIALYGGYRFWGFGGMLAAPLICVVAKEATTGGEEAP